MSTKVFQIYFHLISSMVVDIKTVFHIIVLMILKKMFSRFLVDLFGPRWLPIISLTEEVTGGQVPTLPFLVSCCLRYP